MLQVETWKSASTKCRAKESVNLALLEEDTFCQGPEGVKQVPHLPSTDFLTM